MAESVSLRRGSVEAWKFEGSLSWRETVLRGSACGICLLDWLAFAIFVAGGGWHRQGNATVP